MVENLQVDEAAAHATLDDGMSATRARIFDLWPKSMLAAGVILTIIWIAGLLWLVLTLLAAV